jgi:hypothetical protein
VPSWENIPALRGRLRVNICDSAGRPWWARSTGSTPAPPFRRWARRARRSWPASPTPTPSRAYRTALTALADWLGTRSPVSALDGERIPERVAAWFTVTWGQAAPATFNARLNAVSAATA